MMIPTLFGVTLVTFIVMKFAPGDPMLTNADSGSGASSTSQHEAFLLQKREQNLDKPPLLNFRYFHDYKPELRAAAFFRARKDAEVQDEIPHLNDDDPQWRQRRGFLRDLNIPDFDSDLADPEAHPRLARKIAAFTLVWCEDAGAYAVPAAISLLNDSQTESRTKIGLFRCLTLMVLDPLIYAYSNKPSEAETPAVLATWRLWWQRNEKVFPPIEADTRQALSDSLQEMVNAKSKAKLFDLLDSYDRDASPTFARFFAEKLLGESTLAEKNICTLVLKRSVDLLQLDTAADADDQRVADVVANWQLYYDSHKSQFEPTLWSKLVAVPRETQYARMLYRLLTFNFGTTFARPLQPVSEKIMAALKVSAPLMIAAQLLIFFVAVPLGILCASNRGKLVDRLVSFALFLLFSVPAFVAVMLLLEYFCYGHFLRWFPMGDLHSPDADQMGWWHYTVDYCWHAFLPVLCTSLFSLASVAMYSRSSLLDVINQDYMRTARAKGVSRVSFIFKHALRNALIPIVTLFSTIVPAILGGSVLVEKLFNIHGMGWMSWDIITQRDPPTVMALIYVEAIAVLLSVLATDLCYVLIDPRIGFGNRGDRA